MRLRQLLNRYANTTRLLLASLTLVLALNGVAYLAHHHTVDQGGAPATHVELCNYCAAFGGVAGAPTQLLILALPALLLAVLLSSTTVRLPRRIRIAPQARAPPRC